MSNPEQPKFIDTERPQSLNLCTMRCLGDLCALQIHIDSFQQVVSMAKAQPDNEALHGLVQSTHAGMQEACMKYRDNATIARQSEAHGDPFDY